jgi:hypothetical protein
MDISNRALGLLLVAAIVISIGGTVISLNKLDGFTTTGMATNPNGTVDLAVGSLLSIVLDDNAIDFGSCTLPGGQGLNVDSALGSGSLNNSACGGTFPDTITVRNNGNLPAEVNITSDISGTAWVTDSWFAYKAASADGGCTSGLQSTYTNLTATEQTFCGLLQADINDNAAEFSVKGYIAPTATTPSQMKITFSAYDAS